MKKIITGLACLLTGSMLRAQAVPMALEDWKSTQGTQNFFYKNVTKTDVSGNVYVAGATMNNGFPDMLVAKYNAAGNLQWIQQFAGTAPNGVDAIAGMYVTGTDVYVTGAVSNNSVTPETDCITMKLSGSTGSVLWSTSYTGAAGAHDAGKDITLDVSGNVYVSGASYNGSGNTDYLVLKYNSSGTQQWASTWDYTGADDGGYKIALSGTNVNVTGAVTTTTPGTYKMSTIKLAQASGSITATNTSTAVTTSSVEAVTDMALDGSGNVIIVGSQYTGGQHDFYVQKLNASTLSSVFIYTWDGGASLDDYAKAVTTDASGNVFVAGFSSTSSLGRELTLIKLNNSGTHQWTQTSGFSGDDEAADLVTDANGDVYVTGFKTNSTKDYYTAKYSTGGTKIWEIEADGNSGLDDNATNMALDSLNNMIVTGQSKTGLGDYEFLTVKYAQKDIITPTDFDGEAPAPNFMYYRNRGQIIAADTVITPVPEVKFYTNNTYPSFYFGNRKQSFVFARMDTSLVSPSDTLHRIDLDFPSSNESAKTYPLDEQENGYLNYFLAHTGGNGIANVKGNQRLITTNLYNNIDLMCSSNQNGIKYYFIVKPGGDMRDIQMEFTGASSFNLNGTTNELTINSSIGSMTFDKPIVYQLTSGNVIVPVTTWTPDWQSNGGSNKYRFNDGAYNTAQTLIIEVDQGNGVIPSSAINNLTWSTYYGGNSNDEFYDVKTNSSNNVWVTGYSESTNFPTSAGSYQVTNAGSRDALFVKFSSSGTRVWSTYIGGSLDECDYNLHGIEIDASGNTYSAFSTSSTNFPVHASSLSGSYYDNVNAVNSPNSPQDIAIVSFDNNGQLTWATYFGGNGWIAKTYDIALDGNNNLYVTGIDNGFPIVTPSGAYNNSFPIAAGGAYFIAKFNSSHSLVWSTFFGSNGPIIEKLGITSNNDLIIVGSVNNGTGAYFDAVNPGGSAYFDNSFNGTFDGFISKFSGSTNALVWSTLYGGNNDDRVHAVVLDNNDNIYLSGESQSSSSFVTGNPFGVSNTNYSGSGTYFSSALGDAFLTKFNSSNQIVSDTYFGGSANEGSFDIAYKNNRLFIPLITAGDDLPFYGSNPATAFVQAHNSDGQDVSDDGYFAVMDKNFNFVWSSYFGGTGSGSAYTKKDQIFSNICSNDSKYYIVGATSSTSGFPLVAGSGYVQAKASSTDAFIAQFDIGLSGVSVKDFSQHENDDMIVYPNPASNEFSIQIKTNAPYVMEVFDISGRIVLKCEKFLGNVKINSSNLAKGIYIVKATNEYSSYVKKLVIN